jgi:hypothetical protein
VNKESIQVLYGMMVKDMTTNDNPQQGLKIQKLLDLLGNRYVQQIFIKSHIFT